MNNLDSDKFNKIIAKIDSDIGNGSNAHKDTLMAQAIIMTKGKEFRHKYRSYSICNRHSLLKEYLKSVCPRAEFDVLRFSMFREGFISKYYIEWFTFYYFLLLLSIMIYVIWFSSIVNVTDVALKIIFTIVSLIASALSTALLEVYFKSRSVSYFGLGHWKK